MARKPRRVQISAVDELARILNETATGRVLLEQNGDLFQLTKLNRGPDSLWAGYDAAKVREAIRRTAGSWPAADSDGVIERIYRAREEGSRPPTRP